jgi:opacity protein-like surface antigen
MNPSKAFLSVAILFILLILDSPAFASENDDEIKALRSELVALISRLDALEASNQELKQENKRLESAHQENSNAIVAISESPSTSWTDRISIKGDFRQRYENIDEQGKSERNRNRVRARASIIANVSERAEVGLGIASGGDDPVSSNQTLGGGGSTKGLNLDLAYVKWAGNNNVAYFGGKFKNPLFKPGKHALIWDGDWNPEGLGLSWSSGDHFVNAMGTWLESDSRKETEFSYALQAGIKKNLANDMKLTAGIGYSMFGTKGKGSFYGDAYDFFGNSFDATTNTYLYDYEEFQLFADLGFSIGDESASVFIDYVHNLDAENFDSAYAAGFKYASASNKGDWEWAYIYQDIEADAAFGLLVDSDFAGGGTDGRGHIFKAGYGIAKNIKASLTYQSTESNADLGSERDYKRLQLDLALKY